MIRENLESILKENFNDKFQFIVHRFDEVEVGEGKEDLFKDCEKILEVHIFDGTKELFGRRVDDKLETYEPLIYDGNNNEDSNSCKDWIERTYELEEKFKNSKYNVINVAEHIAYDENHLAYVDKTVILSLGKGRELYE